MVDLCIFSAHYPPLDFQEIALRLNVFVVFCDSNHTARPFNAATIATNVTEKRTTASAERLFLRGKLVSMIEAIRPAEESAIPFLVPGGSALDRDWRDLLMFATSFENGFIHKTATLLRQIRTVLNVDTVNFLVLSPDRQCFELVASDGLEEKIKERIKVPVNRGIAGQIAATPGPWSAEDLSMLDVFSPVLKTGIKSAAGAALRVSEQTVGVIHVGTANQRKFSDKELLLLELAADRLSSSLEGAMSRRRYDSSQRQLDRESAQLRLLLEINNSLVSKLNIRELFAAVSASLRRITRHHYSQIVLFDHKINRLKVAALDFPRGKGLIHEGLIVPCQGSPAGVVYTSRTPLLITSLDKGTFPSDTTDRLLGEGVRSICLAPLVHHGRALGVLSIGSANSDAFTPADLEVMTQVTGQVAIAIDNALAFEKIEELNERLEKEKQCLEEELRAEGVLNELVGNSKTLASTLKQVHTVARTNANVLIIGETGTGKELLARGLHQLSQRQDGPFVKLNCASIPATLLESELFGHGKGAFTGAVNKQLGRLELADGGTLFLDEIGELPLELQPKLLRVLQDKQFERLGEAKTITVNVRLVAATNRNLEQMVQCGEFRSDLYYRLNVFPVHVPPLRDRKEDIPALVHYFTDKFAREMQRPIMHIPKPAMERLVQWHWPGNVRELENLIERAVILSSDGVLEIPPMHGLCNPESGEIGQSTLNHVEKQHILRTLHESGGLVGTSAGAAARLGLKRTTLYAKMKKLGISRGDFRQGQAFIARNGGEIS